MQLASNYTTFFDKLTRALERLAQHLPQYDLIIATYKGRYLDDFAQRITASLREVYVDIFQFLQRVAGVFSRKDGSMYGPNRFSGLTNHSENKHRPVVMASLIWQPFDARFDEILQQMQSHRTILKEVVDLDQKRANQEARDKAEKMWEAVDKEHEKAGKATEAILDAFQKSEAALVEQQEEHRKAEIARLDDLEKRFTEARDEKQKQKLAAEAREKARHAHENMSELRVKIEQLQRGMKRIQSCHVPIY